MKIPADTYLDRCDSIIQVWYKAAAQESLRTGIFIKVVVYYRDHVYIDEIQFEVMGHLFGSLVKLKRALANKAFL